RHWGWRRIQRRLATGTPFPTPGDSTPQLSMRLMYPLGDEVYAVQHGYEHASAHREQDKDEEGRQAGSGGGPPSAGTYSGKDALDGWADHLTADAQRGG